jgi:uncharacterized protein (TIGR00369 family)
MLELPHTAGCLVCGRDNPHGLHLSSSVDPSTGSIQTTFTPASHHIGFEGIIHGGILATVLDEVMVWSAIWASGRACVAAEMSLRFIKKAAVGMPLVVTAKITRQRSRMIETTGEIHTGTDLICAATGKYFPLGAAETVEFLNTFVNDPSTAQTDAQLRARLLA